LSPALPDALKAEFQTWGPGKYDPRHHAFDGINLVPLNTPSLPIVIPSIYGLAGVGFETFTADRPNGNRQLPDDALARTMAARAVFS